jgi:gluconate 2-dehydrogenase alpha chain
MGNTSTQNVIFDFQADVFDHSNLDFVGGGMLFSTLGERDPNTSATELPLEGDGKNSWGQKWKDELKAYWDSVAAILLQGESLPYEDQFLDLDPKFNAADGKPLLRLTFDWHQNDYAMYKFMAGKADEIMKTMGPAEMNTTKELKPYRIDKYQSTHPTGGAIMGSDPGNSVTNKYGQVWDTPNVFVTGAALYPQNAGVNPTGTLLALAYMAADAIRDKYLLTTNHLIG